MTTAALQLPPKLDHALAASFVAALPAAMAATAGNTAMPLVVDASALHTFDSSALAVLLECRRAALAAGRHFVVAGAPARLTQLATLYGVQALIAGDIGTLAD